MRKKRIIILWGVFLLLCLLAASIPAFIVYRNHTVPLDQCSEIYRRYHDAPGIQASFIRDKHLNDTLSLDMTLFVASDSGSFAQLLKEFGKSKEYIEDLMSSIENENVSFVSRRCKGHPELPRDPDDRNNDVMAIFPGRKAVAFFHIKEGQEITDVFRANFYRTFHI